MSRRTLSGVLAFGLIVALAACAESGPTKTPQQVWIEDHPTHAGPSGECIEFDDEPCDSDPFDLDDEFGPLIKRESPRPMKTATQPKPTPKKTRR